MTHETLLEEEPSLELDLASAEQRAVEHLQAIRQSREQLWDVKELMKPPSGESAQITLRRTIRVQEFYADRAVEITPLNRQPSRAAEREVFFKDERPQPIHSFKIRGAFWASMQALRENPNLKGTAQATAGNAGLGSAAYAEWHNINEPNPITAHTFMPYTASKVKKAALRARDAVIHDHDPQTGERYETLHDAQAGAKRFSALYEGDDVADIALLDPYAHPDTIAGQGTLMVEVFAQLRTEGADLIGKPLRVRVGGGGLGLSLGVAEALQVFIDAGVVHADSYVEVTQEEYTDAAVRALEQLYTIGKVNLKELFVDDQFSTKNDGTAVEVPDSNNIALAYHFSKYGLLRLRRVTDQSVAKAMAQRPGDQDLEPAGSLGLASYLEDANTVTAYLGTDEESVIDVVVLSGSNVSDDTKAEYAEILAGQPRASLDMGSVVTRQRVELPQQNSGASPAMRASFLVQLDASGIELLE